MVNNINFRCIKGNIADQPDVTAIVNAANAQLETGGGVAGAIHRAAGPGLAKECRSKAPIKPGEAVISGAHDLPNQYVIHCLGPVFGEDKPEDELLADCYRNALKLAENHGIDSLAFPAISTGVFGYPTEEAARVAFETIRDEIKQLKSLTHIRFVLFTEDDLRIHQKILKETIEN
ncbi:MAG: macro domain-containing protein [Gracilimonas sp.]|jgi:O-acetyl-ADP-ribose deacetylase (regulator of RNase III)|nr:macro domain-containing protein [Gracilimonas sp.]